MVDGMQFAFAGLLFILHEGNYALAVNNGRCWCVKEGHVLAAVSAPPQRSRYARVVSSVV